MFYVLHSVYYTFHNLLLTGKLAQQRFPIRSEDHLGCQDTRKALTLFRSDNFLSLYGVNIPGSLLSGVL